MSETAVKYNLENVPASLSVPITTGAPVSLSQGPRNKLIAIEGIDGVGKNTQAKLLQEALIKQGAECGFFSFPRYETPTGSRVRAYLDGKLDSLNLLSRAKLYSDDRLAAREEILDLLYQGSHVVCDRYVDSNVAFQSCIAKLAKPGTQYATYVRDYLRNIEYSENRLPEANITFVLTVDVQTSQRMISERYNGDESKKDGHESNIKLLELTHEIYREMARASQRYSNRPYVEVICSNPDGTIRTREDIHQEILAIFNNFVEGKSPGYKLPV